MGTDAYILGTGLSHDGSVCVLHNGRLRAAIAKERISRIKHDGFNDTEAVEYCLRVLGIRLKDISLVVQNTWQGMFEQGNSWFYGRRPFGVDCPVVTISHHLAHAYSAFGPSPFEEAAVLVIDNGGNSFDECRDMMGACVSVNPVTDWGPLYSECDSYYLFDAMGYRTVYKDFSPPGYNRKAVEIYPKPLMHSIGGVYRAVSTYVFGGIDDSGKLMGLAAYGRAGIYDFDVFELRDGRVSVRYDWMSDFKRPSRSDADLKAGFQYYADLARHVQVEIERAVLYVARTRYDMAPSKNLCYAGGVALNAAANRRLITEGPFQNVYIQPAAGDDGLSIGCAYYGWFAVLGGSRKQHDGVVGLGARYETEAIRKALETQDSLEVIRSSGRIEVAADLLASGKVLGWFQGGSELGPRALGYRSILANPRRGGIAAFVNENIKRRELYRPLAPAVLAEDAAKYFIVKGDCRYMIVNATVREEWRDALKEVTHVDGTARIQTVSEAENPVFYALLQEFKSRTGMGLLLNTSLNRRGMPIAETPSDAAAFLMTSSLDALVVEDFVVRRRPEA